MMRYFFIHIVICISVFKGTIGLSQDLRKIGHNKDARMQGVLAEYSYVGEVEGYISLILYKDMTFFFKKEVNSHKVFSRGKWKQIKSRIILQSDIDKKDIPVKIQYLKDSETIQKQGKTIFAIPINSKQN